jgi:hypothetical protein
MKYNTSSDRYNRVDSLIKATLLGTESKLLPAKKAADILAKSNMFSEGAEGKKERSMFIKLLKERRKRMTVFITLEFADEVVGFEDKSEVMKNIMDSVVHTANTRGIAPESTHTKMVWVMSEIGEPLIHQF